MLICINVLFKNNYGAYLNYGMYIYSFMSKNMIRSLYHISINNYALNEY